MMRTFLWVCFVLMITLPKEIPMSGAVGYALAGRSEKSMSIGTESDLTAMEALDIVKGRYAANFEKILLSTQNDKTGMNSEEEYYYKLPDAEYYLVFEGCGETEQDYLYHLYEFVLDEPDTGLGHTVTYGWYTVDKKTGTITDQTCY